MTSKLPGSNQRRNNLLISICLLLVLASCVNKSPELSTDHLEVPPTVDTTAMVTEEDPVQDEVQSDAVIVLEEQSAEELPQPPEHLELNLEEQQSIGVSDGQDTGSKAFEEYAVRLAVDEAFSLHEKGELRVWIGADSIEVTFSEGMAADETTVPANIGQYAKIQPYAPDFDINPPIRECVRIHPSGSEVRFTLEPKAAGDFSVSADIEIFTTDDCTGESIPKSAKTLKVQVTVDKKHVVNNKLGQLGEELWDQFFTFWGALLTVLFGAALFGVRRYFKSKTGYSESGE